MLFDFQPGKIHSNQFSYRDCWSGPQGFRKIIMLNSHEHENHEHEQMRQFSDKNSRQSHLFQSFILKFMTRTNFMLMWFKHEKSFITLKPKLCRCTGRYALLLVTLLAKIGFLWHDTFMRKITSYCFTLNILITELHIIRLALSWKTCLQGFPPGHA